MPSRPLENATQDWTPVVFSKSTSQARNANTEHQPICQSNCRTSKSKAT